MEQREKGLPNNGGYKKGALHPNYGKHLAIEVKEKISNGHIGKTPWNKGKSYPKMTLLNQMGITGMKGRNHTASAKQKMSLARKGKSTWALGKTWHLSKETKEKIALTKIGSRNPQYGHKKQLSTNWKGGISGLKNIRSLPGYKRWRKQILERDHHQCQICHSELRLEVDHIKPWLYHPELRLDMSNGRTLCHECHKKTDTYGGKVWRQRPVDTYSQAIV